MADIHDLMKLTGQGRQAVTSAVDRGDLPGYRVGPSRKIWVPDEAFELLKKGHWRKGSHQNNPFLQEVHFPR